MIGLPSVLLAALAAGSVPPPATTELRLDLVFCQSEVELYLKKGRAFFSLVFTITLNDLGIPQDIAWLESVGVNQAEVEACVRKWRFPSEHSGSKVKVEMHWTHGFGWEWVEIRSPRLHQRITMGGNPCKYP